MRQVITRRTFGVAGGLSGIDPTKLPVPDCYRERLIKYIPAETVILWIAVFGSVSAVAYGTEFFPLFARWVFILGTAGTYFYLRYFAGVQDYVQLVLSSAGFVIWVHAFAVLPFAGLPGYNPVAGALLLPVYSALVPLVDGIPGGHPDATGG